MFTFIVSLVPYSDTLTMFVKKKKKENPTHLLAKGDKVQS